MAPRKKAKADITRAIQARVAQGQSVTEMDLSADPPDPEVFVVDPSPTLTGNQLVAYNMQKVRRSRGWSQDSLGMALSNRTGRVWSKASVSAAESSWRGSRPKRFDANEILALASVFAVPVSFFFLPPDEPGFDSAAFLLDDPTGDFGVMSLRRKQLLELIASWDQPSEYFERLRRELLEFGIDLEPPRANYVLARDPETIRKMLDQLRAAGITVNEGATHGSSDRDEEAK